MTDKQPQALWLADLIDNDLKKAAHHEEAAAELRRQHAEIERLTAALKRANSQAEHFEREWYLRGDEIERLGNLCYDYLGDLTAMRAVRQMQEQKVRFKCTVVDDQHPNGVPLEQWGNASQRQWVGLTRNEAMEIINSLAGQDWRYAVDAIDAKLKKKNGGNA